MNNKKQNEISDNIKFLKQRFEKLDNSIKVPSSLNEQTLKAMLAQNSNNSTIKLGKNNFYRNLAVAFASFVIIATSVLAFYKSYNKTDNVQMMTAEKAASSENYSMSMDTSGVLSAARYANSYYDILQTINQPEQTVEKGAFKSSMSKSGNTDAFNQQAPAVGAGIMAPRAVQGSIEETFNTASVVKSDDRYIYYAVSNKNTTLYIIDSQNKSVAGKVNLSDENSNNTVIEEIYIRNNSLFAVLSDFKNNELYDENTSVLINGKDAVENKDNKSNTIAPSSVDVAFIDISVKASPVKKRTFMQEGQYITSQMSDNNIQIVSSKDLNASAGSAEQIGYDILPVIHDSDVNKSELIKPKDIIISQDNKAVNYTVVSQINADDVTAGIQTVSVLGNMNNAYLAKNSVYLYANDINKTGIIKLSTGDERVQLSASSVINGTPAGNDAFYDNGVSLFITLRQPAQNDDTKINLSLVALDEMLNVSRKTKSFAENEMVNSIKYTGSNALISTAGEKNKLYNINIADAEKLQKIGYQKIKSNDIHFYEISNNKFILLGQGSNSGVSLSLLDINNNRVKQSAALTIGKPNWYASEIKIDNYMAFNKEKNYFAVTINEPVKDKLKNGLIYICKLNDNNKIEIVGNISDSVITNGSKGFVNDILIVDNKIYSFSSYTVQVSDLNNLKNYEQIALN